MSSLKPTVVGLGISLPLLAIVAVAFRFHARRINKLSIGIDDYLSVVALVCEKKPIRRLYYST